MATDVELALDAVWEALPARWCVGHPSHNPGALRSDGYPGAVGHSPGAASGTRRGTAVGDRHG
jgi:hypothetical protein